MYELKSQDKFNIKGRGDVYTMTLPESLTAQDIINEMGKPVEIDGKMFTIAGVESFNPTSNKCGILVKDLIKPYDQVKKDLDERGYVR